MKLKYYRTKNKIELWDVEAAKLHSDKCYPLTESQCKTTKHQFLIINILQSKTYALLNLKHKHKNIRIFAHYKLKYPNEIEQMTREEPESLYWNMHKIWELKRNEDRNKGLIYKG